jgi:DNA-directed RNA polymerase subunit RPC12/RpoP
MSIPMIGGGNHQQQQAPMFNKRLEISETDEVKCSNCDNNVFEQRFMLRKVSRMVIGGDKDMIINITSYKCDKCGTLLEDTIPDELKKSNIKL